MKKSGGNLEYYEDLFEKYRKLNNSSTVKLKVKESKNRSSKSTSTNLVKLRKESNFSTKSVAQLNKSDNQSKHTELRPTNKKIKIKVVSNRKLAELFSKPVSPKKLSQKSYDGSRADIKTDDLAPALHHAQSVVIADKFTSTLFPSKANPELAVQSIITKKSPKIRSLSRKVNFISNLSGKNIVTMRRYASMLIDENPSSSKISAKIKESSKLLNNAMRAQNLVHNIYKESLLSSSQKSYEVENINANLNLKCTRGSSKLPFCCF